MKPFAFIVTFLLVVSLWGCSEANKEATTREHGVQKHDSSSTHYTCPMHPEVISEKPGQCPKCGMDLVKVDKAAKEGKKP